MGNPKSDVRFTNFHIIISIYLLNVPVHKALACKPSVPIKVDMIIKIIGIYETDVLKRPKVFVFFWYL